MSRTIRTLATVLAMALFATAALAAPKIGIMTGTVAQGEEEYRAAEEIVAKYGKDRVIHVTYPNKFMDEQETTISQIVAMAYDPDVKAIVICQAVPGTAAAIDKVHEIRDDVAIILGVPHEKFEFVANKADVLYENDQPSRGVSIPTLAKSMGATKFLHYSFPRHMSYPHLAGRRDLMKKTCGELGMEFIEITAPDPTGEGGVPATQQFMLEDIPRQVAKYGKDIAVFGTNCSMQEPMVKAVIKTGAIYAEQCCPSPFHALPNALGIEVPEGKAGNVEFIIEAIDQKVREAGANGRIATWKVPANIAMVRAGTIYAWEWAEGKLAKKFDPEAAQKALQTAAGNVKVRPHPQAPNFFYFLGESIVFGK